jgi:hypothetical protein
MKQSEWFELVQLQMAYWSNTKISPEMASLQYERVKNVPADSARAVLDSWTGDFPPTVIQIVQEAGHLVAEDLPDFDEVRAAFRQIIKGRDIGLPPARRAPLPEDWRARGIPDLIAAYFDVSRFRLWCNVSETDTTFIAQQRDEWRALTGRSKRDRDLLIAGVDRGALRSGRDEPGKLDPGAALGLDLECAQQRADILNASNPKKETTPHA